MIPLDLNLLDAMEHMQWRDASTFLRLLASDMGWKDLPGEIIMDIGCGPAYNSIGVLLDLFPNVGKIIAVDESEGVILFAKKNNGHPKVEYVTAEIQDESILERWRACASKLFSLHNFHWVEDQDQAFRNIFELLKPGGEAALLFWLNAANYEVFEYMKEHPRWEKMIKHLQSDMPISQTQNWDESRYRRILEAIGFDVVICEKRLIEYTFQSDKDCRGHLGSICPYLPYIPQPLKSEFMDHLLERLLVKCGRTLRGLPKLELNQMNILIRKPLGAKSSSEPPTVLLRASKL